MDLKELKTLIDTLKKDQRDDIDVQVAPAHVEFDAQGRLIYGGIAHSFTDRAFRQWCSKIGIPANFVAQCPTGTGPASRKAIIDHFRATHTGEVLLRLRRGARNVVRAVLSATYQVFDNNTVLQRLAPLIKESGLIIEDVVTKDGNIDIRILYPETVNIGKLSTGEPDIHKFGYFIRNSEVGAYPDVRGNFLVYRSACTNGMVFSNQLLGRHKKQPLLTCSHSGRSDIDLATDFETSFVRFQEMSPKAKTALEEAQGQTLSVNDAERELDRVLDRINGSARFDEEVAKQFRREPIFTRFGIAQALTAAVRQAPSRLRALVEETAGSYILSKQSKASK